jgi:uncharacterized protein DUF6882
VGRQKDIVCKVHGPASVALACRHLVSGVACGFHTGMQEGGDHPDAWCDRCDELLATGGEWTLEMARQADMTVTCAYCYDLAKQRNRDLPAHVRGKKAALAPDEQRKLADYATERIAAIQESARTKRGFDAYERWDFDEEARTLAFTDPERAMLVAEVRLVGAFAPKTSTFEWSWASHADGGLLIAQLEQLKMFGEVRGFERLATSGWPATLADGWEMTAIAGYLLGCEGVYRAEYDDRYWFMLLSSWRNARRGATVPGGFTRDR